MPEGVAEMVRPSPACLRPFKPRRNGPFISMGVDLQKRWSVLPATLRDLAQRVDVARWVSVDQEQVGTIAHLQHTTVCKIHGPRGVIRLMDYFKFSNCCCGELILDWYALT